MTANVTWGCGDTQTKAIIGQVEHDDDDFPVSEAEYTSVIARAAARINGVLISAGFDISELSGDSTTVAYLRAQDLVARAAACEILRSTTGEESKFSKALCEGVKQDLAEILAKPSLLGDVSATTGQVSTPVERADLDLTEAARARRRHWDNINDRVSEVDDPHRW